MKTKRNLVHKTAGDDKDNRQKIKDKRQLQRKEKTKGKEKGSL